MRRSRPLEVIGTVASDWPETLIQGRLIDQVDGQSVVEPGNPSVFSSGFRIAGGICATARRCKGLKLRLGCLQSRFDKFICEVAYYACSLITRT